MRATLTKPARVLLLLSIMGWARNVSAMQAAEPIEKAQDPVAQAQALLDRNTPEQAEALLRRYLAVAPDAAPAHFLLGYVLFREIQTEGAVVSQSVSLPAKPATVEFRNRNARESLAQYTLASQIARPSAFDLKIVSLDYILLDDYADADRWLGKALTWDPNDAQGWYYMGRIRFKEANFPSAIDAFQRALHLHPQDVVTQDNLGLAYAGLGQADAAREAFLTAIRWADMQHSSNDAPWVDMGEALVRESRAEDALVYLKHAVSVDARDLRAYRKLAEAYRMLGMWAQEVTELEQAVQLAPGSASDHFMLGQAYRKSGQADKSRAEFAASAALHAHDVTEVPSSR